MILIMCMTCLVFGGGFAPVRDLDGEERPFRVFTSAEQLRQYRDGHEGEFFNLSEEEYNSYDEQFFREKALVMFLTQGMSGSIR